ncbi:hypothetical protein [Streptomyces katrae]|uniref:Uncharacterized protein n=1 Tax=Streptomyces katrae TaxID=68223 RepID=A0A0F4JLV9_9ACTN|nr:hypothetical protein [Streptomyces katrae]KJY35337.1 hypothetical protein VR44_10415 [Streptomyces katrae]
MLTTSASLLPTRPRPAEDSSAPGVHDQLVFRTALTVPHADRSLFEAVRSETITWIKTKQNRYPDAPSTSGVHHLDATTVLTSQSRYDEKGAEWALRIQLREDRPEATWRTTVTAVLALPGTEPTAAAAVAVALECFPNGNPEGLRPGRPAIVEKLVAKLRPVDGCGRLTVHALQVTRARAQVNDLIEVLCDPDRHHPVVVAARTTDPDPLWSRRMRQVMPQCAGSAGLYLLADEAAVDAFRREIGEHHRVAPGAVRTFLTGTDPAWPPDAARHRFVSPARMRDPADRAWNAIARAAQRHATQAPIPQLLRDLRFPDDEAATQRRRDALTAVPQPRVPDDTLNEIRHLREENALLLGLLRTADEEIEEKRTSTRLAERTTASLEDQLARARQESLHNLQDAVEALEEAQRAQTEANQLRSRLYQQGRHEDATTPVDEPHPLPTSFEELWDRRETFTRVLLTADRETCIDLDDNDRARVWAGKAWVALRALDSYAEQAQSGFKGAFYDFCTAPLPGAQGWPAKQVAMAEGSATMDQFGGQRVFPVPETVDPSGQAVMEAHLKLDSKGATSPRVHFLDDTKGTTQKIIVGYIGPHLRNTKTN